MYVYIVVIKIDLKSISTNQKDINKLNDFD